MSSQCTHPPPSNYEWSLCLFVLFICPLKCSLKVGQFSKVTPRYLNVSTYSNTHSQTHLHVKIIIWVLLLLNFSIIIVCPISKNIQSKLHSAILQMAGPVLIRLTSFTKTWHLDGLFDHTTSSAPSDTTLLNRGGGEISSFRVHLSLYPCLSPMSNLLAHKSN